jgi:hypothetical protein
MFFLVPKQMILSLCWKQDVINTYIFSLVPNPSEATSALYEKPMWSAPFPTPAYIRNRYYETVCLFRLHWLLTL